LVTRTVRTECYFSSKRRNNLATMNTFRSCVTRAEEAGDWTNRPDCAIQKENNWHARWFWLDEQHLPWYPYEFERSRKGGNRYRKSGMTMKKARFLAGVGIFHSLQGTRALASLQFSKLLDDSKNPLAKEDCMQETDTTEAPLPSLPFELWCMVLSFIPAKDLAPCLLVCKQMTKAVKDEVEWERRCFRDFKKLNCDEDGSWWQSYKGILFSSSSYSLRKFSNIRKRGTANKTNYYNARIER